MKTLLFILAIILFVSCNEPVANYSQPEMTALIIANKAKVCEDSTVFRYGYNTYKLPIVIMEDRVYYPAISNNEEIRYYIVIK